MNVNGVREQKLVSLPPLATHTPKHPSRSLRMKITSTFCSRTPHRRIRTRDLTCCYLTRMEDTTSTEYRASLAEAGLTAHQAAVYETLIKNGSLPARAVGLKAGMSRPLAYKVLDELEAVGLVEKQEKPRAVSRFSAAHPLKIKEIGDRRFEAAQGAKAAIEGTLGKLISDFNLQSGKSGVRFFEGLEGIQAVLDDSLTSQTEIYSYADLESIEKYISDINKKYVRERERKQIKKKGIVVDTPFARNFLKNYAPGVTETKLIVRDMSAFHTVMQMYDSKISYITLSDENLIGVIIADPRIYEMHRELFLHTWNATPDFQPQQKFFH